MNTQPIQYVSKQTFDEVWAELQKLKAGQPQSIAIVGFNEVYEVGILHDRIRELEAENNRLHMKVSDLLATKVCRDVERYQKKD
jgi:hypothetical protein